MAAQRTWPGTRLAASLALLCLATGCAEDRSTLPPPLSTGALAGAKATVFQLAAPAASAPASPAASPAPGSASVCSTSAGWCPVPAGTAADLRCTCDAADGSYTYAGSTGEVPPMPAWADPRKKQR